MAFEHSHGNRICLGAGARIGGMQMVSAVVYREQLRGVARVTQNRIEIDDAVEFTAAEDPSVDRHSMTVARASVIPRDNSPTR